LPASVAGQTGSGRCDDTLADARGCIGRYRLQLLIGL